MERVEQSQKKQKRCYDLRNRVKRCEDFTVDDTVLLKNFRARDEKYVGSYLIVDVRDTRCEIESLANKTRRVAQTKFKRFLMYYKIDNV